MAIETTKTKRTRVRTEYAPAEIRENTKARRQWLADRKAELDATPGFEGQIVGTGCLQSVTVWAVKEVAAIFQLRGTCQICGRSVAVISEHTADHGYNRPGWGYNVGRCSGQRQLPAELSIDLTNAAIISVGEQIRGQQAAMKAMEDAKGGKPGYGEGEVNWGYSEEDRKLISEYYQMRSHLSGMKDYVEMLKSVVIPSFGKMFTTVKV